MDLSYIQKGSFVVFQNDLPVPSHLDFRMEREVSLTKVQRQNKAIIAALPYLSVLLKEDIFC
jgi:hypothetical protein